MHSFQEILGVLISSEDVKEIYDHMIYSYKIVVILVLCPFIPPFV